MDSDSMEDLQNAFATLKQEMASAHAKWTATLSEHQQQLATQLWEHHNRFREKHERLEALLIACVKNPTWPIESMYTEYSVVLDVTEATNCTELDRDGNDEALGSRQRAAHTKLRRTRQRLIDAAAALVIRQESFTLLDVAERAGVSAPTLYNHFNRREDLIRAVYDKLVEQMFQTAT